MEVWRNSRRDGVSENQGFPPCKPSTQRVIWTRTRELPYRPSTATAAHNRPDRWQHPTTCQNFEIHPCAEGGVHRWIADRLN